MSKIIKNRKIKSLKEIHDEIVKKGKIKINQIMNLRFPFLLIILGFFFLIFGIVMRILTPEEISNISPPIIFMNYFLLGAVFFTFIFASLLILAVHLSYIEISLEGIAVKKGLLHERYINWDEIAKIKGEIWIFLQYPNIRLTFQRKDEKKNYHVDLVEYFIGELSFGSSKKRDIRNLSQAIIAQLCYLIQYLSSNKQKNEIKKEIHHFIAPQIYESKLTIHNNRTIEKEEYTINLKYHPSGGSGLLDKFQIKYNIS